MSAFLDDKGLNKFFQAIKKKFDTEYAPITHAARHSKDGADPITPIAIGAVGYDAAQSLTDAQKNQARDNINAAPGGFGLGTRTVASVSGGRDANDLSGCGFFRVDQNTPTPDWWYGYQIEYYVGYKYQRFGRTDSFEIVERKQINNVWGDWEYLNPPMNLGVEYRTTERYLGKPVYVKVVDCGKIAYNKQVEHGIVNMRDCISFQGLRGGMPMPIISNSNLSDPWSCYVANVDRTKITLACGTSAEGGNCHVILKYTKTTD